MKIITEPKVHLLSAPSFFPHPTYELPPAGGTRAERLIATAGKVCYDSFGPEGNPIDLHVQNLVKSAHLSVIEHIHVGLFLEGISRGCSHEIVRHRLFNYSQRSTRYTKEDDAAMVLDPYYAEIYERPSWERTQFEAQLLHNFIAATRVALSCYREAVTDLGSISEDSREQQCIPLNPRDYRKWCRGKAKQLLPHALETRMVMTGNLRAWRHFLIMRTSRHAEAEIRRLANMIWKVIKPIAPNAFIDLVPAVVDGYIELTEE